MKLYERWVRELSSEDSETQDKIIARYIIDAEIDGTDRDIYNAYIAKLHRYRLFAEYKKNLALIEKIEAMPYYQKSDEAQYYVQVQYALTLYRMGNYDGAIEHYNGILENMKGTSSVPASEDPMRGRVLIKVANVYQSRMMYDEAIEKLKEAMAIMQNAKYDAGVMNVYKDLSAAYIKTGRCDSALILASLADSFMVKRGNQFFAAWTEKHIAEANGCLGDSTNQLVYLEKALQRVKRTKYKSLEFSVLLDLAEYHFNQKNIPKSLSYLGVAEVLINRAQQSERLRYYDFSYNVYLENKDLKNAYNSRGAYQVVKNEIYETRTVANLAFLDAKSDNIVASKDLKLAQDANQLEQLKLENSKFNEKILMISLVVLGTLILALITLFFIIRNNIKNKKEYNTLLGYTNSQTSDLLQQKEQLLREIHLRVKNNLQIIISVLNLHKSEQTDKARVIDSCKSQIQTMALIHEEIYKSDDLESISFKKYMEEMVRYFLKANSSKSDLKISLKIENFELDLDTIIPTGLIINELLSLMINDKGEFQNIVLSARLEDSNYIFELEDSNPHKVTAKDDMRVRIAEKLIKKQLRGEVSFVNIGDMINYVKFNFSNT